jgi:polysaccharide biosynthesis protein PelF
MNGQATPAVSPTTLPRLRAGETADVTLLLEGTYPYVFGGVSSWIHEIITGLPTVRFAAVFLGSQPSDYGPIRYVFPANLVHVEAHYLMDGAVGAEPRRSAGTRRTSDQSARLHDSLTSGEPLAYEVLSPILATLGQAAHGITKADFLFARQSWEQICEAYRTRCTDPSFID